MKKLYYIIPLLVVFLFILATPLMAYNKGNANSFVSYELVTTDETGTGVFYTPECIGECHLVLKVFFNGSSLADVMTLKGNAKNNINWQFINSKNDDIQIKDVRILQTVNKLRNIETFELKNYTYSKLINDTLLPNNCYALTNTQYYCNSLTPNGTRSVNELINSWVSLWDKELTVNKSNTFYIDYVGYRTPSTKKKSSDIVPSLAGYDMPELAYWNSSYTNCRNITVSTGQTENYIHEIILNSTFDYANTTTGGADIVFLEGNCTSVNSGATGLNHYVALWNATGNLSTIFVKTNTAGQKYLAMFYNNSASPLYSNLTTLLSAYKQISFNNETVAGTPAGFSGSAKVYKSSKAVFNDKFANSTDTSTYGGNSLTYTGLVYPYKIAFKLSGSSVTDGHIVKMYYNSTKNAFFGLGFAEDGTGRIQCDGNPRVYGQTLLADTSYLFVVNVTSATVFSAYVNGQSVVNCQGVTFGGTNIGTTDVMRLNDFAGVMSFDDFMMFNTTAGITYTISASETGGSPSDTLSVALVSPTPSANQNMPVNFIYVNASLTVTGTADACILQWNGVNETMTLAATKTYCYKNKTGLADNTYTFNVFANTTTNVTANSGTRTVKVDTVLPVLSITVPANSTYGSTTVALTFTASDTNLDSCVRQLDTTNSSIASCNNQSMTGLTTGIHYVKVFANDTANNTNVTFVNFTVDNVVPVVTMTSPTNTTYGTTNITLTFTAKDTYIDTCVRQLDGTNTTIASCINQTVSLTAGVHTIRVFANDTVNNTGVSSLITFTVDNIVPTISITQPTNTTYYTTRVGTQNAASDTYLDKCVQELDGTNTTITCNGISFVDTTTGTHLYKVFVNDTVNNTNVASVRFTVDNVRPLIVISSPANTTYYTTTVSLDYVASDSGLDTCVRQLDGTNTTISPKCANQSLTGLSAGVHNVKIFANDTTNNTNVSSVSFTVNTTIISVSAVTPTNTTYSSSSVTYTFTASSSSGVSQCWYIIDTTNISLGSGCVNGTLTSLSAAVHNITFFANNTFGSTGFSSAVFFTVDNVLPTISISSPTNTTYATTNISLTYTVSDFSPVTCVRELNGVNTSISACNNQTFLGLAGVNKVKVFLNDTLNNTNFSSVSFTIDTTPPSISIQSPTNTTYSSTVSLNFTASDSNPILCVRELDGTNTTIASCVNQSMTGLSSGGHTVKVFVNDTANNTAVASISFSVDTTPPTVTIISPTATTYFNSSVPLTFTAKDSNIDKCVRELDGSNSTLTSCGNITFAGLPSGSHLVKVFANDTVNNTGVASVTFIIDSSLAIIINEPANTTYYGFNYTTMTLNYSVYNDTNGLNCGLNVNGVYTNIGHNSSITQNITTVDGLNSVKVNCTNSDGSSNSTSLNFTVQQNLILSGVNITLGGYYYFGTFNLSSCSNVTVNSTIGNLTIIATNIYISSCSGIYANGVNLSGNSNGQNVSINTGGSGQSHGGGGGGGHYGTGGNGGSSAYQLGTAGGSSYGLAITDMFGGSKGGNGGSFDTGYNLGGYGGGVIGLFATNLINMFGTLQAKGTNGAGGVVYYGGAGGGSGGDIVLVANMINASGGIINISGGNGGDGSSSCGGGGGSAGRVIFSSIYIYNSTTSLNLTGGSAGASSSCGVAAATYGSNGTYNFSYAGGKLTINAYAEGSNMLTTLDNITVIISNSTNSIQRTFNDTILVDNTELPYNDVVVGVYYNSNSRFYYLTILVNESQTLNVFMPTNTAYYYTFRAMCGSSCFINNTLIQIQRFENGTFRTVAQGNTSIDGQTVILIEPNILTKVVATHPNYISIVFNYIFSVADAGYPKNIYMTSRNTSGVFNLSESWINYNISIVWIPNNTQYFNQTTNVDVTISDSANAWSYVWLNVTKWNITNTTNFFFVNLTGSSSYTQNVSLNTYGWYYFKICYSQNGTLYCLNKTYIYMNTNATGIGGGHLFDNTALSLIFWQIISLILLAVGIAGVYKFAGGFGAVIVLIVGFIALGILGIFGIYEVLFMVLMAIVILKVMLR